ncbi:MAG: glycosyltransferase, partial [Pseudohongiellaceae bacterium]
GIDILIDLAKVLKDDDTVGFVFVGRGTAVEQIRKRAQSFGLENILFFDEIDPAEIPGLLAQCHVGLIALDPRHRNDNIPGKFLAYMQAGLPVLATINAGNDLEVVINQNRVGRVITSNDVAELKLQADDLLASLATDDDFSGRCRQLAESRFSSRAAVQQIVAALKG